MSSAHSDAQHMLASGDSIEKTGRNSLSVKQSRIFTVMAKVIYSLVTTLVLLSVPLPFLKCVVVDNSHLPASVMCVVKSEWRITVDH